MKNGISLRYNLFEPGESDVCLHKLFVFLFKCLPSEIVVLSDKDFKEKLITKELKKKYSLSSEAIVSKIIYKNDEIHTFYILVQIVLKNGLCITISSSQIIIYYGHEIKFNEVVEITKLCNRHVSK